MEATIKQIEGKWTVNGKESKDWGILEIGLINTFFKFCKEETDIQLLSTNDRIKKHFKDRLNEILVNDPIVVKTKVFEEIFNNPIEQIDNFFSK